MNLRDKKIRIRGHQISALLLILIVAISASSSAVFALAYVVLNWTTTATVVANPKTCFYQWSGATKSNTFSYSVNIFPSVTTIDANITYGIQNWDTVTHTVSICWQSLTTPGNIASLGLKVYNGTAVLYNQYWSSMPSFPTAWVQLNPSPAAGKIYTIYMNITGTASPTGSSTFTFDMQVQNP